MNELTVLTPSGCPIPTDAKLVRVLGIDLGTTNSTVAEIRWDPQKPGDVALRCLEVDQPTSAGLYTNTLVPSIVAIDGGKTLVGEGAKRLLPRGVASGEELRTVFPSARTTSARNVPTTRRPGASAHRRRSVDMSCGS